MDEIVQEDWLDRQLREANPYIDDAGFTTRVMGRLPRRRRPPQFLRATILLTLTILGSALSFILSGNARFVTSGIERVAMLPLQWVFVIAGSCGILITSLGLIAAISKVRDLQSY